MAIWLNTFISSSRNKILLTLSQFQIEERSSQLVRNLLRGSFFYLIFHPQFKKYVSYVYIQLSQFRAHNGIVSSDSTLYFPECNIGALLFLTLPLTIVPLLSRVTTDSELT